MPTYDSVFELLKKNNLNNEMENNNTEINHDSNINKRKIINEQSEPTKTSKDQIKNITQTKPAISLIDQKNIGENTKLEEVLSFENLVLLSSKKREIQLKYDLENVVNLIKFSQGKIDISFNERLDKNFCRNLSEKLLEWTGKRWVITLAKETGQKTFNEMKKIKQKEILDREKNGEIYKSLKKVFSDIELLEIKKKE